MRTILATALLMLLVASSGAANTERGMVNTAKTDTYVWLSGGGQAIVTLMWLNGGADLVMALACGDGVDDPIPFAASGGLLAKFARVDVGIPPGLVCALAVTAARNGSQYFVSFLAETDGVATGFGRIGRALAPEVSDRHAAVLEEQLERLKRMAR